MKVIIDNKLIDLSMVYAIDVEMNTLTLRVLNGNNIEFKRKLFSYSNVKDEDIIVKAPIDRDGRIDTRQVPLEISGNMEDYKYYTEETHVIFIKKDTFEKIVSDTEKAFDDFVIKVQETYAGAKLIDLKTINY